MQKDTTLFPSVYVETLSMCVHMYSPSWWSCALVGSYFCWLSDSLLISEGSHWLKHLLLLVTLHTTLEAFYMC